MFENFRFVLKESTGEYFMWASDDDEFSPTFVEKCLDKLIQDDNIVLCTPICKVIQDGNEIMKYKPDFHTVGLDKMSRIKKIAFYIKKSHGALFGLYRKEPITKFSTVTYLDADGIFLLQLSQYGTFYQLNEVLMTSYIDYIENNVKTSTTFQKEKMVDLYKMKPKYFLMKYEKITMFLFITYKSFGWKKLTLIQHFTFLTVLYRSFWGYDTLKPTALIRNLFFFIKKKNIIVLITQQPKSTNIGNQINSLIDNVDKILICYSDKNWGEEKVHNIDSKLTNSLKNKHPKKISIFYGSWTTKQAHLQYSIDYIKENFKSSTHCLLISDNFFPNSEMINVVKTYINKLKYFNRKLEISFFKKNRIKKFNLVTIFPIRKYVIFQSDEKISMGSIKISEKI